MAHGQQSTTAEVLADIVAGSHRCTAVPASGVWAFGLHQFGYFRPLRFQLLQAEDAAFRVIMVGLLLQLPTLVTLAMLPILMTVYIRLAHRDECEGAAEFGEAWTPYASFTPRWFPRLASRANPRERAPSAHG